MKEGYTCDNIPHILYQISNTEQYSHIRNKKMI